MKSWQTKILIDENECGKSMMIKIIMNEPKMALTYRKVKKLYKIVANLIRRGIEVLFVLHKLDELKYISDSISIMYNGKNVYEEV